MKWFVEEKGFRGNWCPAIYYSKEPPSERGLRALARCSATRRKLLQLSTLTFPLMKSGESTALQTTAVFT